MSSDTLDIKRLRPSTSTVNASYTRPGDTTAYAAGDVVADSTSAATVLTFSEVVRFVGGGGIIQGAQLIDSAAPATFGEFELYLFDTVPAMQNDNAAWAPSDSEMEKCIGVIPFPAALAKVGGSNLVYDVDSLSKSFNAAASVRDIYGVLVVRNAYTPANAEKFTIRLHVLRD